MHQFFIQNRIVASAILVAGLNGCGSSTAPEDPAAHILVSVGSEEEFTEIVKNNFRSLGSLATDSQNRTDFSEFVSEDTMAAELSSDASPVSGGSTDGAQNSSTNLIEQGVDEADLMKFDGEYIFTVEQPNGYYGWGCIVCGVVEFDLTDVLTIEPFVDIDATSLPYYYYPVPVDAASIHVHRTSEDTVSADWVSSVELSEAGLSTQGLYLSGDRGDETAQLISINTSQNYGWGYWANSSSWENGKTSIHFFNANDPEALTETQKLEWQGYYVDSRIVDGVLYVVSRHTPELDGFLYYPQTEEQEQSNLDLIDSLEITDILPKLIINDGDEQGLVSAENCVVPQSGGSDWPSIITITAISLTNPTSPSSTCAMASNAGLYASTNALYLSQTDYNDGVSTTRIHKFAFTSNGATYSGSGEVDGHLGWGLSSSFRLSESGDFLRVVSTSRVDGAIAHKLTVLSESTIEDSAGVSMPSLSTVAILPNDQRPAAIGKPGEDIYGVRFLGDRGYVVTFRQTDPLYVLDLTEPTDPFIAGELEIPGFSEYLQLLDEDTLLGIGRSSNWDVQVSLFDVADPANPSLVTTAIAGAYSNASYDYHAIAWVHDSVVGQTKMAFPVTRYGNDGWSSNEEGLAFFTIDTLTNSFVNEDFMSVFQQYNDTWKLGLSGSARSLIQGDSLHYINEHLVWSADQADLSDVLGPQGKWAYQIGVAYNIEEKSSVSVSDVQLSIEGEHLLMSFTYGSCLVPDTLYVDLSFQESSPVQVSLKLVNENDESGLSCIEIIRRADLRFNLDIIKTRFQQAYQVDTGIVQLNLEGIGSIEYSF